MASSVEHVAAQRPRLILSMDGLVLREIALDRERITVGRRPSNQIQIEDLAISAEHARITTILGDVFLEDLDSTNGTSVNGKPVTKRVLVDGDVVEIGKYRLKFVSASDDAARGVARRRSVASSASVAEPAPAAGSPALQGVVRVIDGPHAGRELPLLKARTMLGSPGGQVVAITRKPSGFCIVPIDGARPTVNGSQVGRDGVPLGERALIELAGVRMQFEVRA